MFLVDPLLLNMCLGGVVAMPKMSVAGLVFGVTAGVGAVLVFDSDLLHCKSRDKCTGH